MEEIQKSRPRFRPRLFLGIGAGLIVVALLAVFLPSILSTSWGKGFLESRLAKSLQMPVSLDSCSLGWRSPTQLKGLRAGPSQQGLSCTVASVDANFTVWDWLWHGEDLQVEILRPEISLQLPLPETPQAKPPEEVIAKTEDAKPQEPPPTEEKSSPYPFRKLKLSLREGLVKVSTGQGVSASANFELDASLLTPAMEGSFDLAWKQKLNELAAFLPSSAEKIALDGDAKGSFSGSFNRVGVEFSLAYNAKEIRASAPSWKQPLEESLLKIESEGRANWLLGEGSLKSFALSAKTCEAKFEAVASATDRFREWRIQAELKLLLDRLAPFLVPILPSSIPCEGPLQAQIEAKLPRRHPEQARGTIQAAGRLDGKAWQLEGSYDGSGEEPRVSLKGHSEGIPVRPSFLSTLAYPIPLLATKESHLLHMESDAGGEFHFEATGSSLARLQQSVKGEAHMTLSKGTLSGPSALSKILPAASGGGLSFEKIDAPFHVENSKITTPGIVLDAAGVKLTMIGTTGFDGAIDYTVRVDLPEKMKEKGWGAQLEQLFGKEGLPVGLTGSVSDPKPSFRMPEWKEAGKVLLQEGIESLKKRRKKD